MKKQLLILLITILSINCYSQISFEKGYYINNANQMIDCQIRNLDWRNNPIEFEYRLSENNETQKTTIKSVKEFGIYNISKYIRKTINIDRSSDIFINLSYDKNPTFKEEELFLKVLVEGKSNLYEYVEGNLRRYFYDAENSNIEQLIFKRYKKTENNIALNNRFRQQLWNDLRCPNFKMSKIQSIDYKKNDLVRYFTEYSKCSNDELIKFEKKEKKDLFNLTLRPRLNSSSLTLENNATEWDTDFGNKSAFGFGIEAEFILPFNKNKWSIVTEPTYQYFKSKKSTDVNNVSGGKLVAEVDYKSVEISISLRHYFFLNNNSKFFVNASVIFDLNSKSSIEYTRDDGSNLNSLEIDTPHNFALGMGYKHHNKYSIEMRYQTIREILGGYVHLKSEYNTTSIIFGYSLF